MNIGHKNPHNLLSRQVLTDCAVAKKQTYNTYLSVFCSWSSI